MENKQQFYCLAEECGWTCNNGAHGIFTILGALICPILAIILLAMKYSKFKTIP